MVKETSGVITLISAAFSIACTAHADLPKFPDLSADAPVNVRDYTIDVPNPGRPPFQRCTSLPLTGWSATSRPIKHSAVEITCLRCPRAFTSRCRNHRG